MNIKKLIGLGLLSISTIGALKATKKAVKSYTKGKVGVKAGKWGIRKLGFRKPEAGKVCPEISISNVK
jgi:hypothetical protein